MKNLIVCQLSKVRSQTFGTSPVTSSLQKEREKPFLPLVAANLSYASTIRSRRENLCRGIHNKCFEQKYFLAALNPTQTWGYCQNIFAPTMLVSKQLYNNTTKLGYQQTVFCDKKTLFMSIWRFFGFDPRILSFILLSQELGIEGLQMLRSVVRALVHILWSKHIYIREPYITNSALFDIFCNKKVKLSLDDLFSFSWE